MEFKTDSDICTEYSIYNITDASVANAVANDNIIEKLLNEIKPIEEEIENNWKNPNVSGSYSSFEVPSENGILQFDMWNIDPNKDSDLQYDWDSLKKNIKMYGLRNSLLVAPMPTASTSQIFRK